MPSFNGTSEYALALPPGTMVAQYRIEHVLGRPGGFGITYLATDLNLEAQVALKEFLPRDVAGRGPDRSTVLPYSASDGELFRYGLDQFLREARTLARLDHPNLVRVRSFVEAHATAYLVMDYYEGQTLLEYLWRNDGRIPWRTATEIVIRLLDGLSAAHEKGILHRDVKPENIYLVRGGRPVLLDFGAAREAVMEKSKSMTAILTPGFAPIEQYGRHTKQGPWTDVYAVAAVLYQCVTGERPPDASDRIIEDVLQPVSFYAPQVPKALEAVVHRGLATLAPQRPQSARELQELLLAVAARGSDGAIRRGIVPELVSGPVQPATDPGQAFVTYAPPPQNAPPAPTPTPTPTPIAPLSVDARRAPPRWLWFAGPATLAAVVAAAALLMSRRQAPQPAPQSATEAQGATATPTLDKAIARTTTTPPLSESASVDTSKPKSEVRRPKSAGARKLNVDSLLGVLTTQYYQAILAIGNGEYDRGMPLLGRVADNAEAGLRVHPNYAALRGLAGNARDAISKHGEACRKLVGDRLSEVGVASAEQAREEVQRLQRAGGGPANASVRQRLQKLNTALALLTSCSP